MVRSPPQCAYLLVFAAILDYLSPQPCFAVLTVIWRVRTLSPSRRRRALEPGTQRHHRGARGFAALGRALGTTIHSVMYIVCTIIWARTKKPRELGGRSHTIQNRSRWKWPPSKFRATVGGCGQALRTRGGSSVRAVWGRRPGAGADICGA
ncbi:hypothetical protein LXA43DRAFT_1013401 [Ganoderma leucocontextum]|nr:hypothetical protein LXA43DRAFT_1013401 [Ganoderma leucocontextum]